MTCGTWNLWATFQYGGHTRYKLGGRADRREMIADPASTVDRVWGHHAVLPWSTAIYKARGGQALLSMRIKHEGPHKQVPSHSVESPLACPRVMVGVGSVCRPLTTPHVTPELGLSILILWPIRKDWGAESAGRGANSRVTSSRSKSGNQIIYSGPRMSSLTWMERVKGADTRELLRKLLSTWEPVTVLSLAKP